MIRNSLSHDLNLLIKKTRSRYLYESGVLNVVCCTCGNSARYLREVGCNVVEIGEYGLLSPQRWLLFKDVRDSFPIHFDATSGHLPMHVMSEIAKYLKQHYKQRFIINKDVLDLPTGSGETLVILKMAYPDLIINAHYNLGKETEYNEHAPLNNLVKTLANKIIF